MKKLFSAEKMSTHCHWVGVIDWRLRNFHGYLTGRGSTYNAYLVKGEGGYVLIDTVKAGFEDEFMSRIETVCDPREIRVVVSNHAEMDHTGALPQLLNRFSPDCRILASRNGAKAIQAHFSLDREIEVIKSGQTAEILGKEFVFLETPMIHWPDSMLTYFVEDKILFSNDAFGMHLASVERWYDEFDSALAYEEALRYYANIITPYSQIVAKFLDKFDSLALDIDAIAPDHGLCWRGEGVEFILGHYKRWASVEKRRSRKVAVVFDTMWESTELMARHIAQGVRSEGVACVVLPVQESHRTQIATELLETGAVALGSPTLNAGLLPTVADALCYVQGLKFTPKFGLAFGSYGWGEVSVKLLNESLGAMGAECLPSVSCQYVPTDAVLLQCREAGARLAAKIKEEIAL